MERGRAVLVGELLPLERVAVDCVKDGSPRSQDRLGVYAKGRREGERALNVGYASYTM